MALTIASINVNGITEYQKRAKVFEALKLKNLVPMEDSERNSDVNSSEPNVPSNVSSEKGANSAPSASNNVSKPTGEKRAKSAPSTSNPKPKPNSVNVAKSAFILT